MNIEQLPTAIIGVAGGISVGKTTLVENAVSDLYRIHFENLLKDYPHYPLHVGNYQERWDPDLLGLVREDPHTFAMPFQADIVISSLTLEGLMRKKGGLAFLDRTMYEHRHVFGKVQHQRGILTGKALEVYDLLFDVLAENVPPPLAYVGLTATVDALKERIRRRGRPQEQWMLGEDPYLYQLQDAYDHFFGDIVKEPVITVDTNEIVLGDNGELDHKYFEQIFPYIAGEMRRLNILDVSKLRGIDYSPP